MPKYKGKDLYEWGDWEKDMNWFQVQWYRLLFKKEDFEHKIRQGISFWYQRQTRGWDDSDTWSLDYTLAKMIAPRLRRFKELNDGIPTSVFNYLGLELEDQTDEAHQKATAEWDRMLDEMIWAFDFMGSEERWSCYDQETWDRVQKALTMFGDVYTGLWW